MSFQQVSLELAVGFLENCKLFAGTLLFSLPLGLLIAFCSMSKFKPLSAVSKTFVWCIRGTPLMLQLFVVMYVPGLVFHVPVSDRMTAAMIAFVINYACYFSEIYRGGIESIPKGQYEAAQVLGYSKLETFFTIILPQVFKIILPSVTNEVITLVKDTSLSFVIAIPEMFTVAKQIAAADASIAALLVAGLFYYIFNILVAFAMEHLENKMSYYD